MTPLPAPPGAPRRPATRLGGGGTTGGRRWRAAGPAAALLVAVASAVGAQETAPPSLPGIQGEDDRRGIASTDWPWTAIGRVNRTTGGYCTGALIAADRVLTAAHCLWDPRQGRLRPASVLYFISGYDRGAIAGHAAVRAYRVAPGYDGARREDPRQALNDWAVLALASPIETIAPLPILPMDGGALDRAAAEGRLVQAGYSQDRPHMLSIDAGCPVDRLVAGGRLVVHGCDAVSGDSGSPLLVLGSRPAQAHGRAGLAIEGGAAIAGLHIGSARATGASGERMDGRGLAVPAVSFAGALTDRIGGAETAPAAPRPAPRPMDQRPRPATGSGSSTTQ